MTDTASLLRATGTDPAPALVGALDALHDCAQASSACAAAMVRSGGMADEVRLASDCADVCAATARVLARGPGDPVVVDAVVTAAAAACAASAAACGRHADHHAHCALHAASARACAEALAAFRAS